MKFHSIQSMPLSPLSYALVRKKTHNANGTDMQNGLAPHQTTKTFYSTALRTHKFCCMDRAEGIWVLQADLSLLHGEESHVELRLEKGGRRKQSPRAALIRTLHMAFPQHCLPVCLDKKIWDISSLKPWVLRAKSPMLHFFWVQCTVRTLSPILNNSPSAAS